MPDADPKRQSAPGGWFTRAFARLARRSWFAATVLAGRMTPEARDKALTIIEEARSG